MATVKIKLVRSSIGAPKDQKETLRSLRLRKMNKVVEFEDTPSLQGRIRKVRHLVQVLD